MTFHQARPDNGYQAMASRPLPVAGCARNWIFRLVDIWYTIQLTEGEERGRPGVNRLASAGTGPRDAML
jgi:hypothetical protein